ncbi:pilus assembly protein CpaF [Microbacterium sp. Root53]|uniref:TadA family conjugal transfer-associated ATPase n=1 Tax=Microbacterium sp. Root53 TaxID=1736553 RepID=UPI0006FA2443|nr:TadA family conjugal transfer-associated ATPase [Microbacterium sp. Root53]KQY96262.1 pilus assembly protein CpaF [Microbacterium sp. Root53]
MTEPFIVQPRGAQPAGRGSPAVPDERPEASQDALGPLSAYLRDPAVTDVFVNGASGVFVDRGDGPRPDPAWRASEREVRELATALIARGGRHIDDATPCVDVRLQDGIRVHAVLPPIATSGTALSIRIPRLRGADLDALCRGGSFGDDARRWLVRIVRERENLLVTGAAGTGKTTLLGALLAHAPGHERIVTIEDVAELRIAHPHHVSLEARQPNLEGAGGVDLARLVRESLRMRPDRIVVGECRGEEVRELLTALNTGHDGGAGTLHASGLAEVPARLEALGALAGMDDHAVTRQVCSAIGFVLHLERRPDGSRRLARVGRFTDAGGRLGIEEVTPWRA